MNFKKFDIQGPLLIEPVIHGDHRGYFLESYRHDFFCKQVRDIIWVQDNESLSKRGVLRGLHYQLPPYSQSKLVRVISGKVLDVIVDIRPASPTFGKHISVELDDVTKKMLFVPQGFAHGFVVLSDTAIFAYKVDNYYSKESDRGIKFDDPALGINWLLKASELSLSEKDLKLPLLSQADLKGFR